MKVYLDDMRTPPPGWVLTSSVGETINLLRKGGVTHLSLDHDLGLVDETGYDVLLWLEEQVVLHQFVPPALYVHSDNSSARIKMELAIRSINSRSEKNETSVSV